MGHKKGRLSEPHDVSLEFIRAKSNLCHAGNREADSGPPCWKVPDLKYKPGAPRIRSKGQEKEVRKAQVEM